MGTPYTIPQSYNVGQTNEWHVREHKGFNAIIHSLIALQKMFDLDDNLRRVAPVTYFMYAPLREQFVNIERVCGDGDYRLFVENRHYELWMTEEFEGRAVYWPCRVAYVLGALSATICQRESIFRLQSASYACNYLRYGRCYIIALSLYKSRLP